MSELFAVLLDGCFGIEGYGSCQNLVSCCFMFMVQVGDLTTVSIRIKLNSICEGHVEFGWQVAIEYRQYVVYVYLFVLFRIYPCTIM